MSAKYEEVVGTAQLATPQRDLTANEMASIWECFAAIEKAWTFEPMALALKPQWLDMVAARINFTPSYLGEFANAALVVDELQTAHPDTWIDILFFDTVVTEKDRQAGNVVTRLQHAKYFVVNDFVHAFILLGGFTAFGGRNYTGFMGGSRFGALPPVRVGGRQ